MELKEGDRDYSTTRNTSTQHYPARTDSCTACVRSHAARCTPSADNPSRCSMCTASKNRRCYINESESGRIMDERNARARERSRAGLNASVQTHGTEAGNSTNTQRASSGAGLSASNDGWEGSEIPDHLLEDLAPGSTDRGSIDAYAQEMYNSLLEEGTAEAGKEGIRYYGIDP